MHPYTDATCSVVRLSGIEADAGPLDDVADRISPGVAIVHVGTNRNDGVEVGGLRTNGADEQATCRQDQPPVSMDL